MDAGPRLEQGATGARSARPRALLTLALLLVPVLAALAVPVYARATPGLAGVPFFYWFQAGCVLLAAVCLGAALLLSPDGERSGGRSGERSPEWSGGREEAPW